MITVEITIPVLNEQDTLEENINILIKCMENISSEEYEYKLAISDNGSTDSTAEIAKKLERQNEGLVRYVKVGKKGVGLALKSSWVSSEADIVGYMDLDLATDINHIPEAILAITKGGYDVTYGTRLHKDSRVIGRGVKREITSRIFNFIVRNYLGIKFSDGMCGFKFIKRSYFSDVLESGASSDGWFFCTELLVVSEWLNLKLFELPVKWTDDNTSKVRIVPLAIEYISAMKKLKSKKVD